MEIFSNNNIPKKRVQWWKIMRCNFYCLIVWAMLLVVGWCCCGCFALCRLCFLNIFGLMLITRTAFALKKPKAIKIFMTHWVITSNPQTWVMATPPNSLTSPPPKRTWETRPEKRKRKGKRTPTKWRWRKNAKQQKRDQTNLGSRTRGDIKKIYCFMIFTGVTTSGGKTATVSV